jgi:hypothetical protein
MDKSDFYRNVQVINVEWWLSWCHEYPDLFWARLRVFSDGKADVSFQDENKNYGFNSEEFAGRFLNEDEFSLFENMDEEDMKDLETPLDVEIEKPNWAEKSFEEFIYIGDY